MICCYVLCGIPGSGKTTLGNQLAQQHNAVVRSYDDLPGANTKSGMDGNVTRTWLQAIRTDLEAGRSVVCDGINLTGPERKEILSHIADIPCKKVLAVKVIPLEICLQRNAKREARLPDYVLEQAARRLEPPTPEEGWDEIYISRE